MKTVNSNQSVLSFYCVLSLIVLLLKETNGQVYYNKHGHLVRLKPGYQACANLPPEPKAINKQCCYSTENPSFYFDDISFCCNGEVYDLRDRNNKSKSCCNGQVIKDEDFICCENNKHQVPQGYSRNEVMCCGNVTLTKDELCCYGNNRVTKQRKSKNINCCAGEPFNNRIDWCQNGQILPKNKKICEGKIINLQKQSCCGDKINNWSEYKRDIITEIDKSRGCCGTKPFNNTIDKCCPFTNHTIPKHRHFQCSNKGYYNITSEIKCLGTVHKKKYGRSTACCGFQIYNKLNNSCCSDQIINPNITQCCGFRTPLPINSSCCGYTELKKGYICCANGEVLVVENSKSTIKCCVTLVGAVLYDTEKKVCKGRELITKKYQDDKLCGVDTWYKEGDGICCLGKFTKYNNSNTNIKCCGFFAFDETTQTCCRARVVNIPSIQSICCSDGGCHYKDETCRCVKRCNGHVYNSNIHICCGDILYIKTEQITSCCGRRPYWNNHTCCQGRLFEGQGTCCGSRKLKSHQRCCGGFAVQWLHKQNCCVGRLPYDSRYNKCNKRSGFVELKQRKHSSPKCRMGKNPRKRHNDWYNWIPSACNSKHGFSGVISDIKYVRRKGIGYQKITLTNIKVLKRHKYVHIPKKSLEIIIPYKKDKSCFSRHRRLGNMTIAVFTSAAHKITKSSTAITTTRFNFMDKEVATNNIMDYNTDFYITKYNRTFKQTFRSLMSSKFCERRLAYHYKNYRFQ